VRGYVKGINMKKLKHRRTRGLLSLLLAVLLAMPALPLTARAAPTTGADGYTVVSTYKDFRDVVEDKTTLKIRLGANIQLENSRSVDIEVGDKTGDLIIDGDGFTLSESKELYSIGTGCISLPHAGRYKNLKSITVKNMTYYGVNEYGIIYVWDTADNFHGTVTFDGIN
jgi:NAD(P)H-hydrate repair Nnr-like enzyme with NAD(P)H-hydrate dehydratase domain